MSSINVPPQFKAYAASYRFGYEDAAKGDKHKARERFSTAGAWSAYQAGFISGTTDRRRAGAAATVGGPLFDQAEGRAGQE